MGKGTGKAERERARGAVCLATLLVGAPTLRMALTRPHGGRSFKKWTLLLAGVWFSGAAVARALGPPAPEPRRPRSVLPSAASGAALAALFLLAAPLTRVFPRLRRSAESVLGHREDTGSPFAVAALALVTGAAEELFFRGPLFDSAGRTDTERLIASTAVYAVVTAAAGNPALVLAAVLLGLVAGRQRTTTGDVVGPVVTHLVWTSVLYATLHRVLPASSTVEPNVGSAGTSRSREGRSARI